MTFVRSRFDKSYQWELSRYAARPFTHVIGGASRLLTYFIRCAKPRSIITYADRRFSVGNLYEKLGFTWLRDTRPGYSYVIGDKRQNRLRWQKHLLADKLPNFDPALTEHENMHNHGYYRIFDCGNRVYGLILPDVKE